MAQESQVTKTKSGSILTKSADCGFFTPLTVPRPGTCIGKADDAKFRTWEAPILLKPLKLKSLEFKNRLFLSPMAQYSCKPGTGTPTDYHLVHYGQFAMRGVACVMTEATAIAPNGRMTPEDCGIWSKDHVTAWKRIVDFVHSQGGYMGLQLNHAGRRGSVYTPQILEQFPDLESHVCPPDAGGWTDVWAPSALPYSPKYITPVEMTMEDIEKFKQQWTDSVRYGAEAGFDVIELHVSHGYLLHNFISPLSNKRTDRYGGSLENRMRLILEISQITKDNWPKDKPVFCRLSATDWYKGGEKDSNGEYVSWGMAQSEILMGKLLAMGIDFFDITSGGLEYDQAVWPSPGYNAPLAAQLRKAYPKALMGTVGLIKTPERAEEILQSGAADVVSLGRELLRQADFLLNAATEFGAKIQLPTQWHRAITWSNLVIPGPQMAGPHIHSAEAISGAAKM